MADYDEGEYDDFDAGQYDGGQYDEGEYEGENYGEYGYTGDEDLNLADENYEETKDRGYNDFERAEQTYGEERSAFERTEKQTGFVSMKDRRMNTEEENFAGDVSIKWHEIKNMGIKNLPDLLFLQDKISMLGESVKYKNPLAYILGYYCLEKEERRKKDFILNEESLENCKKIIDELENIIKMEDVIRYAFYWKSYLL